MIFIRQQRVSVHGAAAGQQPPASILKHGCGGCGDPAIGPAAKNAVAGRGAFTLPSTLLTARDASQTAIRKGKLLAEPRHLIYGLATCQQKDADGEICFYASAKPAYLEFSQRNGPLCLMHDECIRVGRAIEMQYSDSCRSIFMTFEIFNQEVWRQILRGRYRGFSHAGDIQRCRISREEDAIANYYFLMRLDEVSLVERPQLRCATFQIVSGCAGGKGVDPWPELRRVGLRHSLLIGDLSTENRTNEI